ncbi:MAG: SGNH/GDSL hydrolase family protein [Planctomycetaceae bacterium]|nr:SGNH/GDSL hydrolase family protein [Planctomycetaceae bacterium]
MKIRLSFIKNFLWAFVWLISLICCTEVGLRVHTFLAEKPLTERAEIETVACHQVHHQLEPLGQITLTNPDTHEQSTESLNSFGLRGPEPELTKPDDVIRILCLGDEMTFGPGLSRDQLFTSRLEEMLKDYLPKRLEVINAGVPGYCPLLSFLQYRHRLRSLDPDVIVVTFEMGDVADDYRVRSFTTHDEHGIPLGCRNPRLGQESELKKLQDQFVMVNWLKQKADGWKTEATYDSIDQIDHSTGRYAWIRDNQVDWRPYLKNTLQPVEQLVNLGAEQETGVIFSVLPAPWQVSSSATSDPTTRKKYGVAPDVVYTNRQPFEQLSEFATSVGLEYLDNSTDFTGVGNPDELFLHSEPWLSARGHEVYATLLARYLYPRLQYRLQEQQPTTGNIIPAGGVGP